ncbi:MAG: hypothetical protein ABI775_01770 [Pseudonocardiales bacterium]|nr:hypothetical protein [Actinomycetota bacterium]
MTLEAAVFVVLLTDEGQLLAAPRAVGPFEDFDVAQSFSNTLIETWTSSDGQAPQATVVRVEEPMPGVVVGEI